MAEKEIILFQCGVYNENYCPDDYSMEEDTFNSVMQGIKAVFEPCVLIGKVGRWNGTFSGYKYCRDFKDLQNAISGYDDIIIRQIGTQLHFTLIHHDGRHEMELRRFNDYGYNNRDNACFDYFNEQALKFINRYTKNYGKIPE
jgi:hypothetical protein